MRRSSQLFMLGVIFSAWFGGIRGAAALTWEHLVTPAFVKDNPKPISVVAEKRADGLIRFTMRYFAPRPSYLVADTEVRDGEKVLFQTHSCAFLREKSATYDITIAAERVADAKCELFVGSFEESEGNPVPIPGGVVYKIELGEFAKTASEKK